MRWKDLKVIDKEIGGYNIFIEQLQKGVMKNSAEILFDNLKRFKHELHRMAVAAKPSLG
jgi:hypothetical protein